MATTHEAPTSGAIRSLIPARIDRLPWSPFHTRIGIALGVAWILGGLQITVPSAVVHKLTAADPLHLSTGQAGFIASMHVTGEGGGWMVSGQPGSKLGRKKLFIITLA